MNKILLYNLILSIVNKKKTIQNKINIQLNKYKKKKIVLYLLIILN